MSELLENGVELHYEGPVTLDGSQSVHLSGRAGGIAAMLWEALDEAGWVGERTSVRMTVALRIGISPCPDPSAPSTPVRRVLEGGWTDDHGVRWHQQVGPLSGRAVPGFQLIEDELQPGELTVGERILRTAAIEAGWLAGDSNDSIEKTEIPDVRITVAVARRIPR